MPGRAKLTAAAAAVLAAAVGAAGCYWLGNNEALTNLRVRQVSADDLATAMAADRFYEQYRGATLVLTGVVAQLRGGSTRRVVRFATSGPWHVDCQVGSAPVRPGQRLTVVTEGAQAIRVPDGMVLPRCTWPG